MKIIRTIIFCAGLMVYTSLAAQASIKNITNDTDFSTDKSRLLSSSDISQLSPQGFSLSLPEQTPITDYPQVASVQFITGEGALTFSPPSFSDPSVEICKDKGYTLTKCDKSGQIAGNRCPYNSAYFEECCDSAYKYSKSECSAPLTISSDSCGGKYKCYCDTSKYKYTSCTAPQVLGGSSCSQGGTTRYSDCVCPSNYNQTCTAQNQQGSGTGCTYGGTTKYTACKCKSGYTMTCGDKGPVTPSDYCLLNGIKYYNNCKTCENKCTLASCPAGASCTYEECSQKYCAVGCATNYTDWCTKPETDCAKLGYTKAASDCPDGYLKCPYNSSAVFCEDEPEEPEAVTCATGKVLGNDNLCYDVEAIPSNVTPIGVVYTGAFVDVDGASYGGTVVVALKHATSSPIPWSQASNCNIPELEDVAASGNATDVLGKTSTQTIVSSSRCVGSGSAAYYALQYQPAGCTAEFCKKGQWFLPSSKMLLMPQGAINTLDTLQAKGYNVDPVVRVDLSEGSANLLTQSGNGYWSSNEFNATHAFVGAFALPGSDIKGASSTIFKSTSQTVRPILVLSWQENGCSYSFKCSGYNFISCRYGIEDSCTACGTTKYKCKSCSSTGCSGYTLTERQACDTCTYGSKQCKDSCGVVRHQCCSSSEAYLCFKCTIDDDIMAQ